MMRYHDVLVLLIACSCCLIIGCSEKRQDNIKEKQVLTWLRRWEPLGGKGKVGVSHAYGTYEGWIEAGSNIEGIEETIIKLWENGKIPARKESDKMPIWPLSVCDALFYFGSSRSVPLLVQILHDPNQGYHEKLRVISTLGRIADKSAVGPLCEFILSDEDDYSQIGKDGVDQLKLNTVGALGMIGDPNAIDCIEEVLSQFDLDEFDREYVDIYLNKLKGKAQDGEK